MVTIEQIKATLFHFRSELHHSQWSELEPGQNKIISYKLSLVLDSLEQLFFRINTPEEMIAALPQFKHFFEEFWHEIPWYMALPHHPILHFFCDVASLITYENNKSVSEHDTPLGLMELMMPTIQTVSSSDHYPNLNPHWNSATQQWDDVDIKNIIKTHILGRNLTYLIPVKVIFALDSSENALLFNPYYNIEVHPPSDTDNLSILSEEEIQRLQDYSSDTQSFFDNLEMHQSLLNEAENLLGYLTRLAIALKKNSIAGSGSEFSAGERGYIAIFNFMQIYDTLSAEQKEIIPYDIKQEIEILREQASDKNKVGSTASCFDTRGDALEELIAIEENRIILNNILLGKDEKNNLIQVIYEQLRIHKEKVIADPNGADSLFITNWGIEKIEDLHRINATIAPLVRESISTIKTITSFFVSVTHLRSYIQNHHPEHIRLFLHFFGKIILQSIIEHQFHDALDSDDETDDDDNPHAIKHTAKILSGLLLGLTIEKTKLCFESIDYFQAFLRMSVVNIDHLDSFLIFLKKCDQKQKDFFLMENKALLMSTIKAGSLLQKVIGDSVLKMLRLLYPKDDSVIFKMYDELLSLDSVEFTEYITIALNELRPENATLLYQWIGLNAVAFLRKISPIDLPFLNDLQRDKLYQILEPILVTRVQSSEDVKNTLSWLNPAQQDRFYNHIKLKIRFLIKTGKDVANLLQHLNLKQYEEAVPIIKEIPSIFDSFQDMEYCLETLEETQTITFERLLSDFYPIKSAGELAILLNFLSIPLLEEKLSRFKFRLEIILRDAPDFSVLFKRLPIEKLQLFFNAYQEDLIKRSWSIEEAIILARFISLKKTLILSPKLQRTLLQMVININLDVLYAKTRYDFNFYSVFSIFNLDLFQEIMTHKYDEIEAHIESTHDLFDFLYYLKKEQQIIFVDRWASSPFLFKKEDSSDYDFVHQAKSTPRRDYLLYHFIKARILSAPHSWNSGLLKELYNWDFNLLKEICYSERNNLMQEIGKKVLRNRIKNIKDLFHLLSCLDQKGCDLVLEMLRDGLARFINSPEDILIIKRHTTKFNANLFPELRVLFALLPCEEDSSLNPYLLENSHKMMSNQRESEVYRSEQTSDVCMTELTPETDNTNKPKPLSQLDVLLSFTDSITTPRKPPIDYTFLEVEALAELGQYPEYVFFKPADNEDESTRKRKRADENDYKEDYKKTKSF